MARQQGPRISRLYVVKGRVQGVGYRYFAQTVAAEAGVTGWVRNRDDGAVESYATGTAEQLAEYSGRLRMGPRFGEVRSLEEIEAPLLQSDGFSIKH
ncbi:acylphosphatase [Paludibaculum fermentans]|uniref:acylphosphatase n=1 Tax=Paludibaculum fermentans TaxID=1473598 RepID=UPI003EBDA6E1